MESKTKSLEVITRAHRGWLAQKTVLSTCCLLCSLLGFKNYIE